MSATSAHFFRYLRFVPSLDVRSPWFKTRPLWFRFIESIRNTATPNVDYLLEKTFAIQSRAGTIQEIRNFAL